MNFIKKYIVEIGVLLVGLVVGYLLAGHSFRVGATPATVYTALEATESILSDGTLSVTGASTFTGDVTFTSGTQTVNGVASKSVHQTMATATTTPCALLSPTATSTLVDATANFTVSSTTASTITFAKATTAFATTTILATSTIAANGQAAIYVATTTPVSDSTNGRATLSDRVFAPSTYLVMSMTGGTGTFSPSGACNAQWMSNQ